MLQRMPEAMGRALRKVRPGLNEIIFHDAGITGDNHAIEVASAAFAHGGAIPARFTADGVRLSPPLAWRGVPSAAAAVMLVVEDADSPTPHPFVHAIAWNLPGHDAHLPAGALRGPNAHGDGHVLGLNSLLRAEYLPPDPPPGHGPHRYAFQIVAIDRSYDFGRPPGRRRLLQSLRGHVLAKGCLIGVYERAS